MNPTISREASGPPRPQYIVRLLGICSAIFGTALLIWGHWLWGTAIILAIPLTIWDDRRMTKQAQREARQTRPFPDYEKWRAGTLTSNVTLYQPRDIGTVDDLLQRS